MRSLRKAAFLLAGGLLLSQLAAAPAAASTEIDPEEAAIVVPKDPHPAERYAAEEIRRFAARATGATMPIRSAPGPEGPRVLVGPSPAMRESRAGFDPTRLAREALRIRSRDGVVAVAGGSPRGTLYAAYALIERGLGVRFLTPEHTHVPERAAAIRAPRDYAHEPRFRFRFSYYAPVLRNPRFAARVRINAIPEKARHGGRTRLRNVNHSFSRYVPWSKYGEKHPSYFALHDGKRPKSLEGHQTYETQLCPTHPDVRRIIIDKVLARLERNPERRVISVSQSDNRRYCQCADCRAINEPAGTPMGAQLDLVNAVAEAVAKKHPDVLVGTLAYQYTREPPEGIEPRENVLIQLCSIEACQIHPLEAKDCPPNAAFRRDLAAWAKKAEHLGVWHYNVNFSDYLAPCPNLANIGPNVKLFAEHGAMSAFMQGATTPGAEFARLRNYLIAQMLWKPSRDPDAVIDEFLRLHYGKAAKPIRGLIETIQKMSRASGKHPHCFGRLADYGLDKPALTRAAENAFDRARARAGSPAVRKRVERLALIEDRLRVQPLVRHVRELVEKKRFEPVPPELADRMRPRFERLIDRCERFGVERLTEDVSLERAKRIGRVALGLAEAPDALRSLLAD